MKRTITIMAGAILLLGASAAWAQSSASSGQSLGDVARSVRKKKTQSEPTTKVYDNDNLPKTETLSVVGPEPASAAEQQAAAQQEAANKAAENEKRQQAASEIAQKLDAQKAKIDALSHELDLDQREYRLRAAAFYSDAGVRLRDSAQWDKDDAHYKADIEAKQKALDDAKAQLTALQEEARKAGMKESEEKTASKDNPDESKK
jgi:hypothetical protein